MKGWISRIHRTTPERRLPRRAVVALVIVTVPAIGAAGAGSEGAGGAPSATIAHDLHEAEDSGGLVPVVDETAIPAPNPARNGFHIGPSISEPLQIDGVGAFRINCSFSHMSFDDPIVYPGQPGASHLHVYYGNAVVDALSTSDSIATTGATTCTGGEANRSGYWVPAIIDTTTGAPVVPDGENSLQVYYKTGYRGVPSATVVNMPAGLRIIAGDATATTADDMLALRYFCLGTHDDPAQPAFPECPPGDLFVMSVEFPQCWDGEQLDTADHRSHMAYADGGCPASHPVALPTITQNVRYLVPASGMANWRLASDAYDGPAGYSGHADWWNGWHAPTFQRIIDHCYADGLDCRMNNLGDGQRLT